MRLPTRAVTPESGSPGTLVTSSFSAYSLIVGARRAQPLVASKTAVAYGIYWRIDMLAGALSKLSASANTAEIGLNNADYAFRVMAPTRVARNQGVPNAVLHRRLHDALELVPSRELCCAKPA